MSMCGKGIPIEVDTFEGVEVEWKWKLDRKGKLRRSGSWIEMEVG